jgi:acetyl esterase/lipase
MAVDRRQILGGVAGMMAAFPAAAQWGDPPTPAGGDREAPPWPSREHYPLWPGKPPGAPSKLPVPNHSMNGFKGARELWIRGVPSPEIHVYRPPQPDGSALLTIPGGGYDFISVHNEGLAVAQRFLSRGTTLFILTYRLPAEGWADRSTVPLQDAQRAMRLIRARAETFSIDRERLGVVGFSAGGHLAADLATAHQESVYRPVDSADRQSARPAFAILVYPVTTLVARSAHTGSAHKLVGENATSAALEARSPALHVTPETPPSFLVHAADNDVVPLSNSLDWLAACGQHKVPVEAHIFEKGGHGFGVRLSRELPGSRWPELAGLWMDQLKIGKAGVTPPGS